MDRYFNVMNIDRSYFHHCR